MPTISDDEWARYRDRVSESTEMIRRQRAEIEELDKTIATLNEREKGWKTRVDGLEAELRRRGWPDSSDFLEMQIEIDQLRQAAEDADLQVSNLQIQVSNLQTENRKLAQKSSSTTDWKKRCDTLEEAAASARLRADRAERERDQLRSDVENLRLKLRTAQFFANQFQSATTPATPSTGLQLPEGVTVDDLLRLCHPDRHQGANNDRANAITRWLLQERKKP